MESPGKILMKQVWRFQQIGGLVAVVLMCLNLTILLYEYMGWRFEALGIPHKLDWLIMLIIFLLSFFVAFMFGVVYDRVLKLWKHREIVNVERNPYRKGRINPMELVTWQYVYIPLLMKHGLKDEAEFNLRWNEANMEHDPELRKEVYRIIEWVNRYKLKNVDDRWLDEISKITEKRLTKKYGKIKPDW